MRLSDFIRQHFDEITQEWEAFARTCEPAAARMTVQQLRDHILPLFSFVALDMDEPQSSFEQKEKAQGRQPSAQIADTEAQVHAALRVIDGFTIDQVIGEYRALRACILRLWLRFPPTVPLAEPTQITRFNESIDQMLSESVQRHAALEISAREEAHRRDAFLATLSHELRNPLAAIVNAVHLVDTFRAGNPNLAVVTAMLHRQTGHLSRLLDDLLDLARISRDRVQLKIEPTDMRLCLQDAIDGNGDLLRQKAHILKVDMPVTPLVVNVDSTRIVQVVSNLLNNAAKYSPSGTEIQVSLTADDQGLLISVRDKGGGIDAESLPRIFDAFYSDHESDLAKDGLGIGLWLSRKLVELHGGTIGAVSDGPGTGSEFSVRIPAARGG